MGGASRREILSIKPEILFLRAVSETSLKAFLTHSLASGVKGYTTVEGCQGAHSFDPARIVEIGGEHTIRTASFPGYLEAGLPVDPLKRIILVESCGRKETRMGNEAGTQGPHVGA